MFLGVEWAKVFAFDTAPAEIFVRGTLAYLLLFLGIRMLFKRETADIKTSRLLVLVLVADAIQNGMAGDYHTLPDGLLLVAVIMGWSYLLDWLSIRFEFIEHFMHPDPLLLVEDGKIIRKNMKAELITRDELMEEVRLQGLENISQVRRMWIEGDGRFSVLIDEHKEAKASDEASESVHRGT